MKELNEDDSVHGVLVQWPLPDRVDPLAVASSVAPTKDVDGLHPDNVGLLLIGAPRFVPCTPAGIQRMLLESGISTDGKHVVICGRSMIVGRPLAALLMQKQSGAMRRSPWPTPALDAYPNLPDRPIFLWPP